MRYIDAIIEIKLFEKWSEEKIEIFKEAFSDFYNISDIKMLDNITLTCKASSTFDDNESSGGTLAYCLSEDMLDNDFELEEIVVIEETITSN